MWQIKHMHTKKMVRKYTVTVCEREDRSGTYTVTVYEREDRSGTSCATVALDY